MTVFAITWSDGFQQGWDKTAATFPKIISFLLILVVGWLIAKAIGRLIDSVLEHTKFDQMVERGGLKQMAARTGTDASTLVSKLAYYALFLLVLQMAFGVFGPNPVSDLLQSVIAYIPRVIVAIIVVVVAGSLAAGAKQIVQASLSSLSYGKAVANATSVAIVAFGIFAALNQLQIAPQIVNGLFYAILAVIAGSAIVAIGGGAVQPMQSRIDRYLRAAEEEGSRARAQVRETRIDQTATNSSASGGTGSETPTTIHEREQRITQAATGSRSTEPRRR